mgnify:CR=1 FL=1
MNLIQRMAARVFGLSAASDEGERRSADWSDSMFLADLHGRSTTGIPVHPETALNMATVHACVRVLSEAIAVMPLVVYRRLEGGGKERARSHPLYRVLVEEPNPDMTPSVWKQTLMHHLLTWGNAYARIEFDGRGVPTALWPLEPACVQRGRDLKSGAVKYLVTEGTTQYVLDAGEVLHIPGLSHNGRDGLSPVGLLRETIGLGLGLERFAGEALDNGAWMAYVLRHPGELEDETFDRLRKSLKEQQGGIANSYKPGILEDGMEIQQLRMPGDDAMFLNLRKFEKREIASAYRVPPHMLADLEGGASYSSIEVQSIEFARYSLGIWLSKWAEECTRKLLVSSQFFIEFVVEALLRGDTRARYEAYRMGRDGGWLSVDEIRSSENYPPLPDGAGEGYLVPLNMGVVGSDSAQPQPVDDGTSEERQLTMHLQGAAVAAANRMVAKELDRVQRYQRKDDPDALAAWADRFYANQRGPWLSMLEEYAGGIALALTPAGTSPDDVAPTLRQVVRNVVDVDLAAALEHVQGGKADLGPVFDKRARTMVRALTDELDTRLKGTNR